MSIAMGFRAVPSGGRRHVPPLLAGLGLAWNVYGIVQFARMLPAGPEHLVSLGMTPVQAQIYAQLPGWMTLSFSVGVFGGALGSLLLFVRRAAAVPPLMLSLAGYAILCLGDVRFGVFAAFGPPQVAVLTLALAAAAGLLLLARTDHRAGAGT